MTFYDHFSHDSAAYRAARPSYPDSLFDWLASSSPSTSLVWDCACGSGQASVPLSARFDCVVATDASGSQLAEAVSHERVEYRLASAEDSGLETGCADLVTVAQAAHWLEHGAFHREVQRVLRPGGLFAVWCYSLHSVSPEFDAVLNRFYREVVGPYWPPRRAHVDSGYRMLPFPFKKISTPQFEMSQEWSWREMSAYLRTWSSTRCYLEANGTDPVALVTDEMVVSLGGAEAVHRVTWPLSVVAGYAPDK